MQYETFSGLIDMFISIYITIQGHTDKTTERLKWSNRKPLSTALCSQK